jgi:predicted permease
MNWWQRLFKTNRIENELESELQFHMDLHVAAKLREGLSEEEARRIARLEFGGREQVKEDCRDARGTRWVESVGQDLSFALRTLWKNPSFAAVAVLTLALGIGANTAVFTIVDGVLLRPLPFDEPEKLFYVSYLPRHSVFAFDPGLTDGHYLEFRRQDQVFEHVATVGTNPVTLTGAGDPVRLTGSAVTPDFLKVLRVNPAMGRGLRPEDNHTVLLGNNLWRSRFGADPGILGKTITLDGVGHAVAGVMPPGFNFPGDSEIWTPLVVQTNPHNSTVRPVIGRLKPGVLPSQAQAELETIARRLPLMHGEERSDFTARVIRLKDSLVGNVQTSLLIFAGAVAFVLLIACANVANLLLIRATSRRQEISVRAALGASRWRLIRQLLTENTMVSLAGGTAGTLLAMVAVPALLALAPLGKIPRMEEIHIGPEVLAFTLGISVLTGLVFGFVPAWDVTRRELRESLGAGGRALSGSHGRFRNALVVAEIALALVLLSGAGLMLKSFARMRAVDPGFHPDNVLTMTVDLPDSTYRTAPQINAFHERTLEKLSRLPGVVSAGAVNWLPLGEGLMAGDFQLEGGRHLPPDYMVDKPVVSPGYFRTIGIRLLSGRDFAARDHAGAPGVVIVSQSVARQLWPGVDPVGKRISMEDHPGPGDWLTIIGVVDDVRQQGLTQKADPAVYQPYSQVAQPGFLTHMTFAVRTASNPLETAPVMRDVLREVDRNQPAQSIATMQDVIAATTTEPRFQSRLLAVFAGLALLLAAVGIYGVLAYSVNERTREIGIRVALGAGTLDVVRAVILRSLALATGGVALGMAGALLVTRVLAKFLFEVQPTDPATFVSVALLLTAVALLASWVPARRAARVDPVVALRFE